MHKMSVLQLSCLSKCINQLVLEQEPFSHFDFMSKRLKSPTDGVSKNNGLGSYLNCEKAVE